MTYEHLNINERTCIYQLWIAGVSIRKIANSINRNPSTVSRELKRNYCGYKYKYLPTSAEKKYKVRRTNSHRKVNITEEQIIYIENKLNLTWSPEQIYEDKNKTLKIPSTSTIYRLIHRKLIIQGNMKKLRRKGKFKRPQETRGRFNIGKGIKKRPKSVYKRNDFGHWEADTVESGRTGHQRKSKFCFVTLAERKSRLYLAKLVPNKSQEIVTEAIIELLSKFPSDFVKTITCDRGKEFAGYERIEEVLKCDMYFADPYCAWQKGTNENSNGLLREFYPKGMNLSETNNTELNKNLNLINNRPRKCNNFTSSNEIIKKCCN